MKKKNLLVVLCLMIFCLTACGQEDKKESGLQNESNSVIETEQTSEITEETEQTEQTEQTESVSVTETEQTTQTSEDISAEQSENKTEALTEEQALKAIKNYCSINNPELEKEMDSDEYTVYWDVETNENSEIVVLFRSYTGSQTRYYIEPISGETYVTELVPGIIDEEQRTDVSFNARDYLD
jgi:hypothetical protein